MHSYNYNGLIFNQVTVTIGVIGILVPIAFSFFVYLLLKRHSYDENKRQQQMAEFLFKIQREYAAEKIDKRKEPSRGY